MYAEHDLAIVTRPRNVNWVPGQWPCTHQKDVSPALTCYCILVQRRLRLCYWTMGVFENRMPAGMENTDFFQLVVGLYICRKVVPAVCY